MTTDEKLVESFRNMTEQDKEQVMGNLHVLLLRRGVIRVNVDRLGGSRCGALDEIAEIFARNGCEILELT